MNATINTTTTTTTPNEHEPHEREPSAKKQKCDGHGTPLCCPLARDAKDFILHVLKNYLTTAAKNEGNNDTNDISNPLDYLSDLWLQDRDIANLALESNTIRADELPALLKNDRSYLLQAVRKNPDVWNSLPETMQADPEFIASIPIFTDLLLLHDVFGQYPDMVHQREIWVHALDTVLGPDTGRNEENREIYRQLLHDFAPESIRNDKEIMRRSSTFVPRIYSYFGSGLKHDKDFFQSIYSASAANTATAPTAAATVTDPAVATGKEEEVKYANV